MILNDKLYRILKWICIIVFPAFGTLWTTLAPVWHLPLGEEIPKTLAALETFFGAILCLSTVAYNAENKTQTFIGSTKDPNEDDGK